MTEKLEPSETKVLARTEDTFVYTGNDRNPPIEDVTVARYKYRESGKEKWFRFVVGYTDDPKKLRILEEVPPEELPPYLKKQDEPCYLSFSEMFPSLKQAMDFLEYKRCSYIPFQEGEILPPDDFGQKPIRRGKPIEKYVSVKSVSQI